MRANRLSLRGQHVLITAGPTREYWDPVRFLSNGSTGAMGISLAEEAVRLGARVTLVLGPVSLPIRGEGKAIRVIRVTSARDMDHAVQKALGRVDVLVGAAAVSDYRPLQIAARKLKDKSPTLTVKLVRNPDVIARAARPSTQRPALVVGFALETHDLLANAQQKLKKKNLDVIIANDATNMGAARGTAIVIQRDGRRSVMPRLPKARLARRLWGAVLSGRTQ